MKTIAIAAVTAGGKTTIVNEVTARLPRVASLHFDDYTFDGCTALKEVSLPSTLTTIREYSFRNCDSLSSISIPDGVTTIESSAFYDCEALTYVHLPEGATSIGTYAFSLCPNAQFYALKGSYAAQWAANKGLSLVEYE